MNRVLAGAIALAVLTLAACAPIAPSVDGDELPAGISVDVYQTRTDLPARRLQVAISNESDEDLTITAAEFTSTQFTDVAVWNARRGGSTVRAGAALDLPVQLTDPSCTESNPLAVVRIAFTTADGRSGRAEVPAIDRYERLPAMRSEECFAVSLASVAALRIDRPVRVSKVDGTLVAFVPVDVEPTGAAETITIDLVEDTVLFALADEAGGATQEIRLALAIRGDDAPRTFELPIIPTRCDSHAIAEDKQGTIFVLHATAPDASVGTLRLAAAPSARASMYDYFAEACHPPR